MKTFVLNGTVRNDLGRKATKALRTQGLIPCELYGAGKNVHFTVSESAVRKLIYTPEIFLVELDVNGEKVNAVMKEIQFHPVSERVLHIDFLQAIISSLHYFARNVNKKSYYFEKRRIK